MIIEYNVYIKKIYKHTDVYFTIHKFTFGRLMIGMLIFFVKYTLINFRSPNQYKIRIDLLSITISIRISKQSKHRHMQAKG